MNKIVKIIHLCTQNWDGKPTKNYGERFLITWKLPSYDLAIDKGSASGDRDLASDGQALNSAEDRSPHNDGDDPFGKAPGSNGEHSVNISSKIEERASLLPDGTRANKNFAGGLLIGQ